MHESKSNTVIVTYLQSQSFTGFPEQEFNCEDWNAKVANMHDMGDDSTPIGSHQEAGGDAQRAPGDGDDGHIDDGGVEHAEGVLLDVMGNEVSTLRPNPLLINRFSTSAISYLYQSFLIFLSQSFFYVAYCLSIRLLEALLATLLVMWGR
jgi:hypothetical protein